jgi:hypothetical protein
VNITPLSGKAQAATGIIMFFDELRDRVAEIPICHVRGNFNWQKFSQTINVPPKTKEAIILIGLPAALGTLDIDDVKIKHSQR